MNPYAKTGAKRRGHSWKNRPTVADRAGDTIVTLRLFGYSWDTIAKMVGCTRKTAWAAAKERGKNERTI